MKFIGSKAFEDAEKLKKIEFPTNSKLIKIGKNAFANTLIESIYIPYDVKEIEYGAFNGCQKLKLIKVSKIMKEYLKENLYIKDNCSLEDY